MKLAICIASMSSHAAIIPDTVVSLYNNTVTNVQSAYHYNTPEHNDGIVGSYNAMYLDRSIDADILAYIHDDVYIREKGWDARILKEFEDPQVGVVGFGGALWHGTPDLYKTPYKLHNLRRGDYRSNVDDAEVHGARFTGSCDVAVLDGFAIAVRRELLERSGGWGFMVGGCDFLCYDYAICALARRFGYRCRVVGVRSHHLGGRTSTTKEYQEWLSKQGMQMQDEYEKAHRWFYEEFRDAMPWRCQ